MSASGQPTEVGRGRRQDRLLASVRGMVWPLLFCRFFTRDLPAFRNFILKAIFSWMLMYSPLHLHQLADESNIYRDAKWYTYFQKTGIPYKSDVYMQCVHRLYFSKTTKHIHIPSIFKHVLTPFLSTKYTQRYIWAKDIHWHWCNILT